MSVPATWAAGQLVDEVDLNLEIRDQFNGLKLAGKERLVTASASITTTETIVSTVTVLVDHIAREYRVDWSSNVSFGGTDTSATVRFRWASGSSVANTDTLWTGCTAPRATVAGVEGMPKIHHHDFLTPGVTGQVTFGVFIIRASGASTIQAFGGANHPRVLSVAPVGP